VTIASNNSNPARIIIGVDAGRMTLSGAFGDNAVVDRQLDIYKVLPGTLQFAGSKPAALTGFRATMNLNVGEGTVELNNSVNGFGVLSTTSFENVIVGNNAGGSNSDVLRVLTSGQFQ